MQEYQEFLKSKKIVARSSGIDVQITDINPILYDFQKDIVKWACRKGKAAIFAGTGLGKTFMYLEWARLVGGTVLIVAPLSVAYQTIREAAKLNISVKYVRNDLVIKPGQIYITNYERIDTFRAELFNAVVLDESSILKNMVGKTRNKLIAKFQNVPFRLCSTATPSPNSINEMGNHAEFLGYMEMAKMSSVFFVHEQHVGTKKADKWRLKAHARESFYKWLASWAVAINFPSDLGYNDDGFILPPLNISHETIPYEYTPEGMLPGFGGGHGISAIEAKRIRRNTIEERNELIADMVNNSDEQWLIWCGLNDEANSLTKLIPDATNVQGSDTPEDKADAVIAFQDGEIRVLITKIKIAGMGMNLQNSHNMIFNGLDYSWEGYYQAIRRQWRHGQHMPVNVYVVTSNQEAKIYEIVLAKERQATAMTQKLIEVTRDYTIEELQQNYQTDWKYRTDVAMQPDGRWELWLGDSCERMSDIETDSIALTVTSPPFSDIFIYNNTERDLSNSVDMDDFFDHYRYIIRENYRITQPGRLLCCHVQDVKTMKNRDGYRGLKDFSGAVIQSHIEEDWIYRGTVTIWKNPQIVASRNKDADLLFITGKRDSTNLAPAPPDYLMFFRKRGDNQIPVLPYENEEMTEEDWILWAAPVWYDIKETAVLNVRQARANADEKHMCPLQLPLIERCLKLFSNPGELVFDPFAGIGSTGYEALRWNRRFLGIELKPEYYEVACRNLKIAEGLHGMTLFDWAERNGAHG